MKTNVTSRIRIRNTVTTSCSRATLLLAWLTVACGSSPAETGDSHEPRIGTTRQGINTASGVGALPSPIAHWKFDCSGGALGTTPDSAQGGADAVPSNGPLCVAGRFKNAARFDGINDIVQVADQPRFHFTNGLTVSAWVKPSSVGGSQTLVGKHYAMDSFLLFIENGSYMFRVVLPGGTWGTPVTVSTPATANAMVHLAGTFDGKNVSLYVNGVLKATAPAVGTLQDSSRPITIGNHPSWSAYLGVIDDVRLYDVGLIPSQVWELGTDVTPFNTFTGNASATKDIELKYISRTPRLAYDASPNQPVQGQTVNWVANLRNRGSVATGTFLLTWYVDGVPVLTQTRSTIPINGEAQATLPWTWDGGVHNIAAFVDPNNAIPEKSEKNNLRVIRSNSLMVGFWIEQDVRDYFDANQYAFQATHGIGDEENSFEGWAQRHMSLWNRMLAQAIFPSTPDAGLDRVRLDQVIVVPDGTLVGGGNYPDTSDHTVDMMWGFTSASGANFNLADPNSNFNIEYTLLHEVHHARYLADTYGLDIDGRSVEVLDDGGTRIFPNVGGVVYAIDNIVASEMRGNTPVYAEWEVDWLNVYARQRPLLGWANFNSHLGGTQYMQYIPTTQPFLSGPPYPSDNVIKVVDEGGAPVAGARVRIYKTVDPGGGKVIDNTPEWDGFTDASGLFPIGAEPFTVPLANVHGGNFQTCDDFIRIQYNGVERDAWLDLSAVHVAFFRGHLPQAVYVCRPGEVSCRTDP